MGTLPYLHKFEKKRKNSIAKELSFSVKSSVTFKTCTRGIGRSRFCYCLFQGGASTSDLDFESIVLRKMKQAQERKKLIEQMKEDDS